MATTYEVVEAPTASPPAYGLVVAAPTINDGIDWQYGVTLVPEMCAAGGRGAVTCLSDLPNVTSGGRGPAAVTSKPFIVWAADECSALASTTRDFEGRARRALAAAESYEIAAELWSGSLATTKPLADASAVAASATAVTPIVGLSDLEWALGRCGKGERGMIHVTPQVFTILVGQNVLRFAGGVWLSPMGNIVVADAGYTGRSPAGAAPTTTQWAYASSMIYVRRGATETLTDVLSEMVDISVNTIRYVAWEPVVIEWDQCCLFSVELSVPIPTGITV